jgi:hypothetical protein
MTSRFPRGFVYACALTAAAICATRATAATTPYRTAVLADGATAYYEFDTATPADSAGGDNNGTTVGTVTTGVAGANANLGSAYSFAGNGAVRITDAATFDLGTGPVTVELWFSTAAAARGDLLTYKGAGGDFGIHHNSQAVPAGFTGGVSTYNSGFVTAGPAGGDLSAWHHYVITRDGGGNWSAYTDGVLRSNGTNANSLTIASDLLIGANHAGDPGTLAIPFNGQIDEVAWYPLSLSPAQVQNHYTLATAAVPEPASAAAVVVGGMLLAARRSRRA